MPCRDDYGPPDNGEVDRLETLNTGLRKRLDLATRIACELEKALPKHLFESLSQDALKWITEHREKDRKEAEKIAREERIETKRKEAEALVKVRKNAALNKLTEQERRTLGLPDPK
jgi:hypothetical protein